MPQASDLHEVALTMISMALQRDVPQYIAIPWFITNVMARTISASHSKSHDVVSMSFFSSVFTLMRPNRARISSIHNSPSIGLLTSFLLAKTMST